MKNDPFDTTGKKACSHCNGYGSSLKEPGNRCSVCNGTGLVPDYEHCKICKGVLAADPESGELYCTECGRVQ